MTIVAINSGAQAARTRAHSRALQMKPAMGQALALGLTGLAEMATYLNSRGLVTERGTTWRPENVRRVRKYLVSMGHEELRVRTQSDAQRARFRRWRPGHTPPEMTQAEVLLVAAAFKARGRCKGRIK